MTEGILDVAEGHPPFEHVGRVRVPQSVRSNRLVEIGLARIILEDEPEPLTREAFATAVHEQSRLSAIANEPGSNVEDVLTQLLDWAPVDGEDALPVSFPNATHGHRVAFQRDIRDVKRNQLGNTQTRRLE